MSVFGYTRLIPADPLSPASNDVMLPLKESLSPAQIPTRINTFHEIDYQVVTTGNTIEVSNNDNFFGTKKGIHIPITYGNTVIAVIGISGEVEEVRKYTYLAQRITDILLKERELVFV